MRTANNATVTICRAKRITERYEEDLGQWIHFVECDIIQRPNPCYQGQEQEFTVRGELPFSCANDFGQMILASDHEQYREIVREAFADYDTGVAR